MRNDGTGGGGAAAADGGGSDGDATAFVLSSSTSLLLPVRTPRAPPASSATSPHAKKSGAERWNGRAACASPTCAAASSPLSSSSSSSRSLSAALPTARPSTRHARSRAFFIGAGAREAAVTVGTVTGVSAAHVPPSALTRQRVGRCCRQRRTRAPTVLRASARNGSADHSSRGDNKSEPGVSSFSGGGNENEGEEDEEKEEEADGDDDDDKNEFVAPAGDSSEQDGAHVVNGSKIGSAAASAAEQRDSHDFHHDGDNSIYKPDFAPSDERPPWAPDWLPPWLYRMPPLAQVGVVLAFYVFHLMVLSRFAWTPPRFLQPLLRYIVLLAPASGGSHADPLDKPNAQAASDSLRAIEADDGVVSVGYDSLAGAFVLLVVLAFRVVRRRRAARPLLPSVLRPSAEIGTVTPWQVPRKARSRLGATTFMLLGAYLLSGYGSVLCEQLLYLLTIVGVPLTVPTLRAYKVLLGHLMWVAMGVQLLGRQLRPFFPPNGRWIRARLRSNWCWWAIGLYYVSSLLFNAADFVNHFVVSDTVLNAESVVTKLIHPENHDAMAMAVGCIGPCVTAPVFEELLYRGYLLPALACVLPLWLAIPASSVLFAAHHLNLGGMLPLSVLGWAWALAYLLSGNLVVCAVTHAMWNARVFLSALLGIG